VSFWKLNGLKLPPSPLLSSSSILEPDGNSLEKKWHDTKTAGNKKTMRNCVTFMLLRKNAGLKN